ncbi:MAG: 4Fe-4S dicluster domain-containing protein [Desulfosarcinaceae bacterium]|nr:4Fe-4S dicluster domain-containing protein [Desulfosarcinaceae bacterium]
MADTPEMADVFRDLARHLDSLPAGFPPTESGVELRILKRLFTPTEAAVAMGLTMMPAPADAIAQRLERDPVELAPLLAAMAAKGLIFRIDKGGAPRYMAAQFVVGIWEYHLNDLDEALIRDVNEYLPHFMQKRWMEGDTKQLRVIPISKEIVSPDGTTRDGTGDHPIMPYEVADEIIRKQRKIVVADCICRKEHQLVGSGCDAPMAVCLSFGSGAYYYEKNGLGRSVDQAEALQILAQGRDAGLVLQPGNSQRPTNICMCCGCCCQVLKNLNTLAAPAEMVHSNFRAHVAAADCIACEDCIDRCHMAAISMDGSDDAAVAVVDPRRCIGCGVCVPTCPSDALSLEPKSTEAAYIPPKNTVETYINMAKERGLL